MKEISIGDRFKIRGKEYIVCRVNGLYYLIDLNTGNCWDNGMEYESLILESITYNFEKIK